MSEIAMMTYTMGKRPTELQMLTLLDYIHRYPFLAVKHGRQYASLWTKIARHLNSMKGGAVKTPHAWRKCWADKKAYVRSTVIGTSPYGPKKESEFSEIEKRMVALGVLKDLGYEQTEDAAHNPKVESLVDFIPDDEIPALPEDHLDLQTETRTIRPTEPQTRALLDFLERHPALVSAHRQRALPMWARAARRLNAMAGGSVKTTNAWIKYWYDKKAHFKAAVNGSAPYGYPKSESDFSEIERRMVALGVLNSSQQVEDEDDSAKADFEDYDAEEDEFETPEVELQPASNASRRVRPTKEQARVLVEFLEKHPRASAQPSKTYSLWERIAHRLNAVLGGSVKSTDAWIKYWADKKRHLKTIRLNRCSETERRMMALGALRGRSHLPESRQSKREARRGDPQEGAWAEHPAVKQEVEPHSAGSDDGDRADSRRAHRPTIAQQRLLARGARRRARGASRPAWAALAARLNAVPGGCVKEPGQWIKYWTERKAAASGRPDRAPKEEGRVKSEHSVLFGDAHDGDPISTAQAQDDADSEDDPSSKHLPESQEEFSNRIFICDAFAAPAHVESEASVAGQAGSGPFAGTSAEPELDIGGVRWHTGARERDKAVEEAARALAEGVRRIAADQERWQLDTRELLRAQGELAERQAQAAAALAEAARAQQAAAEALSQAIRDQQRAASEQTAAILEVLHLTRQRSGHYLGGDGN